MTKCRHRRAEQLADRSSASAGTIRWCPSCGALQVSGRSRGKWQQPAGSTKVGVTAVILGSQGRFLLGQKGRACSPDLVGKWVTPGGVVEYKETLEAAVERECFEETGYYVKIIRSLPSQQLIYNKGHFVFVPYVTVVVSGSLKAGDDLVKTEWFTRDALRLGGLDVTPLTRNVLDSFFLSSC